MIDSELMKSTILGIAETHLHVEEELCLEGFEGSFVNAGKGKGVAAFSKITVNNITKICQPSFTAISLELKSIKIVGSDIYGITFLHQKNWSYLYLPGMYSTLLL